jgi:hypothetical protein
LRDPSSTRRRQRCCSLHVLDVTRQINVDVDYLIPAGTACTSSAGTVRRTGT